jgi:uncharacterized protein
MERVDVLWHCAALSSAEHCTLLRTDVGWELAGDAALLVDTVPGHVRYRVTASAEWVADRASIDFVIGKDRRILEIAHVGGEWTVDGRPRPDLTGCTDVDLGWTPATNTIPLRRHQVDVGGHIDIRAAWVRFPELDIVANEQRYERLASGRWRYLSGEYDFDLVVSPDGLVLRYGEDLWRADGVAGSRV